MKGLKFMHLMSNGIINKKVELIEKSISPTFSCGGRIRTCDLQVMSLASYQLLHSAILNLYC